MPMTPINLIEKTTITITNLLPNSMTLENVYAYKSGNVYSIRMQIHTTSIITSGNNLMNILAPHKGYGSALIENTNNNSKYNAYVVGRNIAGDDALVTLKEDIPANTWCAFSYTWIE